ncbi:MAG: type II secretion system F family protein [Thermoplasmata archaeon]
MDVANSYRNLNIPIPKYITFRVIPFAVIGILISVSLAFMYPWLFLDTFLIVLLYLLPVFLTVVALFYPVIYDEVRSAKIDKDMYLFITRLGALSASDLSERGFKEIFGMMEMYDELGSEMKRLERMAAEWNMSLSEAARTIAKNTPSELLSDFLERLAYALETHTSPKEFFKDEQKTVMNAYSNEYENMLFRLDVLQELYIASITMVLFAMVLSIIVPFVIEVNSEVIVTLIFFFFVIVSFISGWVFLKLIPRTRIWYEGDLKSDIVDKLNRLFMVSVAISCTVAIASIFLHDVSILTRAAVVLTPLIAPGAYAALQESRIIRRDYNFSSFIRSLAGNTPAQTGDHVKGVGKLRFHDLGTLKENIKALYRRLKMNIDSESSWRYFGCETGSFLINEFSNIFLTSSQYGAHPEETAPIISDNFMKVRDLRDKKIMRAKSLQSVLFGLIAVLTLTISMVFLIMGEINEMFVELDMPMGLEEILGDIGFIRTAPVELASYYPLLLIMIFAQATMSAVLCWHVKGEHAYISLAKFSMMIWISAIVYYLAELGVSIIF